MILVDRVRRPIKIIRLRKSTAIVILVFMFGMVGALVVGYSDLRAAHNFDQRRPYDVCVGSNRQLSRTLEKLTAPATIPPNASPIEKQTTESLNERRAQSRREIEQSIQENIEECKILLKE